jgi:hypothetical protein
MVYSLSPGGQNDPVKLVEDAKTIAADVNIYRITGDWHGGDGIAGPPCQNPLRFLIAETSPGGSIRMRGGGKGLGSSVSL